MATILDWFKSNHPQKKERDPLEGYYKCLIKERNSQPKFEYAEDIGGTKPIIKFGTKLYYRGTLTYNVINTIGWPFDTMQPGDVYSIQDFPEDYYMGKDILRDTLGNKLYEYSSVVYDGTDVVRIDLAMKPREKVKFKVAIVNPEGSTTFQTFERQCTGKFLNGLNDFISNLPNSIHITGTLEGKLIIDSTDKNLFNEKMLDVYSYFNETTIES